MKFSKPVVMIGGSVGIIIDKQILRKLKIERGDWVEVNIEKLDK